MCSGHSVLAGAGDESMLPPESANTRSLHDDGCFGIALLRTSEQQKRCMTPKNFREERSLASQHSVEHLFSINNFAYNKEDAEQPTMK